MSKVKTSRLPRAAFIAYIAAVLFSIRFVFFFLPFLPFIPHNVSGLVQDGTLLGALLGIAEHLVLFPIIAALPAPPWARAAGYGWLVVDMCTDIMAFNGVPITIYLALRLGGHISSALWVVSACWQAKGAMRIIGWLYALDLASYSFLAIYKGSFLVLIPSAFLFPLWLVLVGRFIARLGEYQQVQATV
ncbi:MAG: hypothetical protein NVS4B11_16460 [Ktedonobacteraceae bacterium]